MRVINHTLTHLYNHAKHTPENRAEYQTARRNADVNQHATYHKYQNRKYASNTDRDIPCIVKIQLMNECRHHNDNHKCNDCKQHCLVLHHTIYNIGVSLKIRILTKKDGCSCLFCILCKIINYHTKGGWNRSRKSCKDCYHNRRRKWNLQHI